MEARRSIRCLKRHVDRGAAHPLSETPRSDLCLENGVGYRVTEDQGAVIPDKRHRLARQASKRSTEGEDKPISTSESARYTPANDMKISLLKKQGLYFLDRNRQAVPKAWCRGHQSEASLYAQNH